jgi:hypothetical protein
MKGHPLALKFSYVSEIFHADGHPKKSGPEKFWPYRATSPLS